MHRLSQIVLVFAVLMYLNISGYAQDIKVGDISDGSRSVPVHLIQMIDEDSSIIRTDDQPMLPFSTKNTCGKCHDYSKIRNGWHFTAGDSGVVSGRPGHPWIFVDQASATQIPISLHDWPGAMKPGDVGLTAIDYLQLFGRQIPGGSVGDNDNLRSLDNTFRWRVSGELEINCLSCHDATAPVDANNVPVVSGDDSLTLPMMSVGGRGAISVVSNLLPAAVKELTVACKNGDYATARELHYKMLPIVRLIFCENNPMGIKTAMRLTGNPSGSMRLPLCEMQKENIAALGKALSDYGLKVS